MSAASLGAKRSPGRVIGVAASAGGVEALSQLAQGINADIDAAVLAVLHLPADAKSHLPEILTRSGPLPAEEARHGATLRPGRIYVAAPDRHMIVSGDQVALIDSPRENKVRPAADPLLRSIARAFRERAIGVVLSGTLDDGALGLAAIHEGGGAAVVQDPEEALAPGMPTAALEAVPKAFVARAAEIGALLDRIAATPPGKSLQRLEEPGKEFDFGPSDISCPECGGVLRRKRAAGLPFYRCRVGHAYSPESLLAAQSDTLEGALFAALRTLEEQATTAGRLARELQERGMRSAAERFTVRQQTAAERADLIRSAVYSAVSPERPIDAVEGSVSGDDAPVERPGKAEQVVTAVRS